MRVIETKVYTFDELSDKAKDKAIERVKSSDHELFGWGDESRQSIEAFCDHFGVTLSDWSVGPWSSYSYNYVGGDGKVYAS